LLFDQIHFLLNLIVALFLLRYAQMALVRKDSTFGSALSYLLH
jgi:hypothetical protein